MPDILQKEIKSQHLRLWDIFILAPVLYYAGTRTSKLPPWASNFLTAAAVGIFVYESKNLMEIAQREKLLSIEKP